MSRGTTDIKKDPELDIEAGFRDFMDDLNGFDPFVSPPNGPNASLTIFTAMTTTANGASDGDNKVKSEPKRKPDVERSSLRAERMESSEEQESHHSSRENTPKRVENSMLRSGKKSKLELNHPLVQAAAPSEAQSSQTESLPLPSKPLSKGDKYIIPPRRGERRLHGKTTTSKNSIGTNWRSGTELGRPPQLSIVDKMVRLNQPKAAPSSVLEVGEGARTSMNDREPWDKLASADEATPTNKAVLTTDTVYTDESVSSDELAISKKPLSSDPTTPSSTSVPLGGLIHTQTSSSARKTALPLGAEPKLPTKRPEASPVHGESSMLTASSIQVPNNPIEGMLSPTRPSSPDSDLSSEASFVSALSQISPI